MRFRPTDKRRVKARDRGAKDFRAGKKLEDNPYLHDPFVAYSRWWQTGFLREKNGGTDS